MKILKMYHLEPDCPKVVTEEERNWLNRLPVHGVGAMMYSTTPLARKRFKTLKNLPGYEFEHTGKTLFVRRYL